MAVTTRTYSKTQSVNGNSGKAVYYTIAGLSEGQEFVRFTVKKSNTSGTGSISYFRQNSSATKKLYFGTSYTDPTYANIDFANGTASIYLVNTDSGAASGTFTLEIVIREAGVKTVKVFNGTSFVECSVNCYNGSQFVECEPSYYDGTAWKPCSH